MDEISISSLVGELHPPLNNTLKDPRKNNSCSLSPNLCARERNTEWKERKKGGRRHRTKDDKIKVICEICQALIWNAVPVSRVIGSMNCVAIASRWNPFSLTNQKGETGSTFNHTEFNPDKINLCKLIDFFFFFSWRNSHEDPMCSRFKNKKSSNCFHHYLRLLWHPF